MTTFILEPFDSQEVGAGVQRVPGTPHPAFAVIPSNLGKLHGHNAINSRMGFIWVSPGFTFSLSLWCVCLALWHLIPCIEQQEPQSRHRAVSLSQRSSYVTLTGGTLPPTLTHNCQSFSITTIVSLLECSMHEIIQRVTLWGGLFSLSLMPLCGFKSILLYLKWITYCTARGTLLNVMWQPRMGGEFGGEWRHAYVYLSPFAFHLKLSQHC